MSEELASEATADVTTTDPVAFARAVAELPAGVFVFHGDEHVVIGANRAARTFFGDRPEMRRATVMLQKQLQLSSTRNW